MLSAVTEPLNRATDRVAVGLAVSARVSVAAGDGERVALAGGLAVAPTGVTLAEASGLGATLALPGRAERQPVTRVNNPRLIQTIRAAWRIDIRGLAVSLPLGRRPATDAWR